MTTCILCDGWINPEDKVSREIRGMLNPRGKAVCIEETGREAHWSCMEAVRTRGVTWKEQRLVEEG